MSKKLVAYFSASGVTKSVAERIAKVANADLFEIKPTMPYTNADLDWRDKTSRSSVEMSNPDSRPKIANKLDNMADYDIVLIGFPIWWYVAPTIIDTFVESYDLSGKTIVPFATSGGSGMGKTVDVLSKLSPNAKWQTGKMANGISEKEIKNWVQIVSLADVYTALRAKRIYKPAYSKEEALEIIKKGLCGKFSREYLIAFENYMKKLF